MNGKWRALISIITMFLGSASALATVQSRLVPFSAPSRGVVELKNDGFIDAGAPVYLQEGFVTGEMAGIWVRVPASTPVIKVDYFRVLIASSRRSHLSRPQRLQAFFQMGVANQYSPSIPKDIENAVNLTPGHYWNDIPAEGSGSKKLPCVRAGQLVGAALEFTHSGLPSVGRDSDGLANALANTLYAIPDGWMYSSSAGLEGDWILRVVAHEVTEAECH